MSTPASPDIYRACTVIDQADGVEDGKLYRLDHYPIRHERKLVESLMRAQDRAADKITSFAGSLTFVYLHSLLVVLGGGRRRGWPDPGDGDDESSEEDFQQLDEERVVGGGGGGEGVDDVGGHEEGSDGAERAAPAGQEAEEDGGGGEAEGGEEPGDGGWPGTQVMVPLTTIGAVPLRSSMSQRGTTTVVAAGCWRTTEGSGPSHRVRWSRQRATSRSETWCHSGGAAGSAVGGTTGAGAPVVSWLVKWVVGSHDGSRLPPEGLFAPAQPIGIDSGCGGQLHRRQAVSREGCRMEGCSAASGPDWGVGHYERTAATLLTAARVLVDAAALCSGEHVVDAGCGTGNVALLAAAAGARVTAVAPSPRLLHVTHATARATGLAVRCELGDAGGLPVPDDSVDCYLSNFGLVFAPDGGGRGSGDSSRARSNGPDSLHCVAPRWRDRWARRRDAGDGENSRRRTVGNTLSLE